MADHPLRPAKDRRLGEPLPHQLANPTQAHLIARGPKVPRFPPKGVCGISLSFPKLSPTTGQIPMHYSPVRHSSAPEGLLPFDLHVLGMPPAFNLSHDQTLQFNVMCTPLKMGRESVFRPACAVPSLNRRGDLSGLPTAQVAAQAPTLIVLAILLKSAGLRPAESDYSTDLAGCVNKI